MNYAKIVNFGSNQYSDNNNPLTYCVNSTIDNNFVHGSSAVSYGQHGDKCQMFLSDY